MRGPPLLKLHVKLNLLQLAQSKGRIISLMRGINLLALKAEFYRVILIIYALFRSS